MSSLPDQPPPTPAEGDLWADLIETVGGTDLTPLVPLMQERRALGIERYGTPLQRDNGRDHLVDAQQELLDAAVYLWAAGRDDDAMRVLDVLLDVVSSPS